MRRPYALAGALIVALALGACSDRDKAEQDRLAKIEHRLDVLEGRMGATAAAPLPSSALAPSGQANATSAPVQQTLSPGAIGVLHPAPAHADQLGEVPPDSVGGFVYAGGPVALHDPASRGARYAGLTGLELQGWLRAKEAGRYQLAVEISGGLGSNAILSPDCILEAWLEDREVGIVRIRPPHDVNGGYIATPVVGADLRPGLYKLRLWAACTPATSAQKTDIAVLLKAPGDQNLRSVVGEDLLHRAQ